MDRFTEPKPDVTSESQLKVSITEVAPDPDSVEYPVSFSVDIENKFIEELKPPMIEVSVVNNSDADIILTGDKTRPVFGGELSNDENSSLMLVRPDEWSEEQISSDNCLSITESIPLSNAQYETNIEKESTESVKLNLLGSHNYGDCMPTGEYRFDTDYKIMLKEDGINYLQNEFTWGFILKIERINL